MTGWIETLKKQSSEAILQQARYKVHTDIGLPKRYILRKQIRTGMFNLTRVLITRMAITTFEMMAVMFSGITLQTGRTATINGFQAVSALCDKQQKVI